MSLIDMPAVKPDGGALAAGSAPLVLCQPAARAASVKLVEHCYTLVHAVEAVGIRDLADGEFLPGDASLEVGIERQLNYLLDEVGCLRTGFRLLDIGCGYGHLLCLACKRGAQAVGVNISPQQVAYCRQQGLQVYCCNYRDLLYEPRWHGRFDGIVSNGSLEHWVQPEDACAGRQEAIYRESFALAHRLLDPDVGDARYVTTAIHVKRQVNPRDLLVPWYRHPRGADRRHYSLLHHWMGGYYPALGQLQRCAAPWFSLAREVDGSRGYKIANDFRMARTLRGCYTSPTMVGRILRSLLRRPFITATMIECYFIEQSWDWQFRGPDPPMQLLRQTWRRR